MEVFYFSEEELLFIHYTVMEMYNDSDQAGVKQYESFQTMLYRPKTELYGEEMYPSIPEKACCYYHSIARSGHIFRNGNKRTALTVFDSFLTLNGYKLTLTSKQAEDFTVYLAYDDKFKENDCIHYIIEEIGEYIQPLE